MTGLILAMWIAAAADLGTTEYALYKYPGFIETNPFQRNQVVRVVSHIAVPIWLTYEAKKRPRSRKMKLLLILATAAWSAAATNNVYVMVSF